MDTIAWPVPMSRCRPDAVHDIVPWLTNLVCDIIPFEGIPIYRGNISFR